MNKFFSRILKIFVVIFLLIIVDQVIGSILHKLYFNQYSGQNHSLTYAFRDCKSDILIFGNSRAQHHYDPRIIRDSLKMSCYNAGQDGGHSILMQYAQIKVITNRYSPEIVILEFNPNDIISNDSTYERLSVLLPYYTKYPELQSLILLRGPYEKFKLLSAIYPYNSNIFNIIRYNIKSNITRKLDYEGYIPLKGKLLNTEIINNLSDMEKIPEIVSESSIDTNKIIALKNIISMCKGKNISLYLVRSPIYHTPIEKQTPPSSAAVLALEIISRNNVDYIDFYYDSTFAGHTEWFYDRGHLNEDGATVFTGMLTERLKILRSKSFSEINGSK